MGNILTELLCIVNTSVNETTYYLNINGNDQYFRLFTH